MLHRVVALILLPGVLLGQAVHAGQCRGCSAAPRGTPHVHMPAVLSVWFDASDDHDEHDACPCHDDTDGDELPADASGQPFSPSVPIDDVIQVASHSGYGWVVSHGEQEPSRHVIPEIIDAGRVLAVLSLAGRHDPVVLYERCPTYLRLATLLI